MNRAFSRWKHFPVAPDGWPLFDLEQSLRAQGKDTETKAAAKDFKKAWKHADTKLELAWF